MFLSHNWGDDELGRDNHDRVEYNDCSLFFFLFFGDEVIPGTLRQSL